MKDEIRTYATGSAFRVALETRLKAISDAEGIDLQRLRRQVSFDRFLARLFAAPESPWLLKGGYAMELRIQSARTTKDIDLTLPAEHASHDILDELQRGVSPDTGDFFEFTVSESLMSLEAAPEGGARYPVTATLGGRRFTNFHVDIGIGDAVIPPVDVLPTRDWLGFAGIPAPSLLAITKEQQFAEKLHAYTLPRGERPNSRVKDLVDLILLIQMDRMDQSKLAQSIDTTFSVRGTHAIPAQLLAPPDFWEIPFRQLAIESGLNIGLNEAYEIVRAKYDLL